MTLTDVPLIGRWIYNRRIRNELRELLATSEADWAIRHREWMAVRRPESLSKLYRDALVDVSEERDEAFHLDTPRQPDNAA